MTAGAFDFTRITEHWDTPANREQQAMAALRFGMMADLARGARFVDVACGSGLGFALSCAGARTAIGGDFSGGNLTNLRSRLTAAPVALLDAERLPLRAGSADLIACLEAIYYFKQPELFLRESARVLDRDGRLLLTWPNPARPGFHPSPAATRYPSLPGLRAALASAGFAACETWGAFPWETASALDGLREGLRRVASATRLLPNTIEGRGQLKRFFYRGVAPLSDITIADNPRQELTPLPHDCADADAPFKVLFALATA